MFVLIVRMFTEIRLWSLYNLLLVCTSSWEYFHIYVLYMIYSATSSPSSLKCIHTSVLALVCLYLPFSCRMHWNTYLRSHFLNISYIFSSIEVFCCFLILLQIFTFHLQHFKKFNQHHIYTIVEKIYGGLWFSPLSEHSSSVWHYEQEKVFQYSTPQIKMIYALV